MLPTRSSFNDQENEIPGGSHSELEVVFSDSIEIKQKIVITRAKELINTSYVPLSTE